MHSLVTLEGITLLMSTSVNTSSLCPGIKTAHNHSALEQERFTDWSYFMPVVDWLGVCSAAPHSANSRHCSPFLQTLVTSAEGKRRGKHKMSQSSCMEVTTLVLLIVGFCKSHSKPHFKGAGSITLSSNTVHDRAQEITDADKIG